MVGAGQLARMTYQAGISLGLTVRVLATQPNESAALVAREAAIGRADSLEALTAFAAQSDVVTFDHELVVASQLASLEEAGHCLRPSAPTVAIAQDKGRQRALFAERGFPVPAHRLVEGAGDLVTFGAEQGWPIVAKACRGGYDGRGVWVLKSPAEAAELADQATGAGIQLLAEAWLPIERELAVLVARRPSGDAVTYPVVETVQVEGICHEIHAPAPISPVLAQSAEDLARAIAETVDATGILAVELFVLEERLFVNELAARPHNSGHYSIEGCVTSQFENHLRAILDWPLGTTELIAPAVVTVNVLGGPETGDLAATLPAALSVDGVRVHLYGKDPRPGRKLGHVTALGSTIEAARARARRAAALIAGPAPRGGSA